MQAESLDDQNTAIVTPEEEADSRQKNPANIIAQILKILFSQLFSSRFGNVLPVKGTHRNLSLSDGEVLPPSIFTEPKGQTVEWMAEITGPVAGITKDDSYLVITADGNWDKRRAFVVPKSDPSNQYEISVADAEIDTERREFRAKLGEHRLSFVNGESSGASLDGKHVRDIPRDSRELNRLVTRHYSYSSEGIRSRSHGEFTNGSWVFLTENRYTGRIERFTPSSEALPLDPKSGSSRRIRRAGRLFDGLNRWKAVANHEKMKRRSARQRWAEVNCSAICLTRCRNVLTASRARRMAGACACMLVIVSVA